MSSRQDRHEQWAVLWCSLLGPFLYGEIPAEEAGPFLRQLAQTECEFPDGKRRKPSRATLWRKWKQYRENGLEGLLRRRRSDRGRPRRATQAMIDKAVALKKGQPRRSDHTINAFRQEEFQGTIPRSTLYRGQAGGISAFCSDELEMLQKVYARLTRLDPDMLKQAWTRARQRTIPEIVFLLQQLHDERSP